MGVRIPLRSPINKSNTCHTIQKKSRTIEQYKAGIFANEDAMRVKLCDLRHNSDIRRLKGVTQKDLDRLAEYAVFYKEIEHELRSSICLTL